MIDHAKPLAEAATRENGDLRELIAWIDRGDISATRDQLWEKLYDARAALSTHQQQGAESRKLSDAIHEVGQYLLGARLDISMRHRLKKGYDLLQEYRSAISRAPQPDAVNGE